ncbi:MAG: hypothetical protein EZS28_047678 [Streblomastix strix]|uniref:Uncharacterized protein n=1 Tax=Streblomastix strix TaxID=222440 RepID=A0A5J4TH86_9EUKA|nr:MAG: hypothetical protein EZS28_047678 [Streblomastix strix]
MLQKDNNIIIHITHLLIYIHFNQENGQQSFAVRRSSRWYIWKIHLFGDALVQSELVNIEYARTLVIAISTAGGHGAEYDDDIYDGLQQIFFFLDHLHEGRSDYSPSFPPQPLLARRSVEQIEEEGANEEIDAQLINNGQHVYIMDYRNKAKGAILNLFIESSNTKPR